MLDLFCCAGGASMGYHKAGFDMYGVDIDPQPHYPFDFRMMDAIHVLEDLAYHRKCCPPIGTIHAIHASPPCQAHSQSQRIKGNEHPDLIPETRRLLDIIGLPYIIENVEGAPLRPDLILCGGRFGLGTYRHRVFEISGFEVPQPEHLPHDRPMNKMGRPVNAGEMMHIVGNFSGVYEAKQAMDIYWMVRNELSQAIPPAYSQYIGKYLMEELTAWENRPRLFNKQAKQT